MNEIATEGRGGAEDDLDIGMMQGSGLEDGIDDTAEEGGEPEVLCVDYKSLRFSPQRAGEMLGVGPQALKYMERDFGIEIDRVLRGTVSSRTYSLDNIFELARCRHKRSPGKNGFARPITISVYIQKGGTGKTTSVVSLAIQFSLAGLKVMVIDNDPQANATVMMGYTPDVSGEDLEDLGIPLDREVNGNIGNLLGLNEMFPKMALDDVIKKPYGEFGPHLIPADCGLDRLDVVFRTLTSKMDERYGYLIQRAREGRQPGVDLSEYDVILIDNAPSNNLLTLNAVNCSDILVCPIRMDMFSAHALNRLHYLVKCMQEEYGVSPEIAVIPTMIVRGRRRTALNLAKINDLFPGKSLSPQYFSEDYEKSLEQLVPVPLWPQANRKTIAGQRQMFGDLVARIRASVAGV